jgi:AcrR family transcriptional regulator
MARPRTPRTAWVEKGLGALAAGGPEAVRIESLARALSVTKGGFYGYFDDRRALLDEMLDVWERASVDDVIARVERGGGDAIAKLRRLSRLAGSREGEPVKIDLAVRDWARRDERVASRLKRVDNGRLDYLRGLFASLDRDEGSREARCLLFYALWIGSHFIAADHGARSRDEVVTLALELLESESKHCLCDE